MQPDAILRAPSKACAFDAGVNALWDANELNFREANESDVPAFVDLRDDVLEPRGKNSIPINPTTWMLFSALRQIQIMN